MDLGVTGHPPSFRLMNDDDDAPRSDPPQDQDRTKSGGSPLVYYGFGCAALALLAAIGFVAALQWGLKRGKSGLAHLEHTAASLETRAARAAAELAISRHSDLEFISADDATGAVTFRNKKTREMGTISYQDAAQDKFAVNPGTAVFKPGEKVTLPSWVPAFPGLETREGTVRTVINGRETVRLNAISDQPVDAIAAFYNKRLEEAGLSVTGQQQTAGAFATRMLQARDATGQRSITISVTRKEKDEPTTVVLAIESPVAKR
jgi:hypothetical protein